MQRVPTLDLRRLTDDRAAFVSELGCAYRRFGFCCFSYHGIDAERVFAAYEEVRRFFALPEAAKQSCAAPGSNRGYVGFKVETARTSDLPDLKEFFHVGREGVGREGIGPDDPVLRRNLWPDQLPGLRAQALALYASMQHAGAMVLSAMAEDLGLERDYFRALTDHGNSILRALHYPPVRPEDLPAVRAEAHEDISLITVLVGATELGLQVLSRDGDWLAIETDAGNLVVNVGDMLQRLSEIRLG